MRILFPSDDHFSGNILTDISSLDRPAFWFGDFDKTIQIKGGE
jgi:hypothetical protein